MEKWLLVEWADSSRTVVALKSVANRKKVIFRTGACLLIEKNGERKLAMYLARSDDRILMQRLTTSPRSPTMQLLSPLEDTDYSGSESSWVPSDAEESESEVENVRPQRRVNAVRPWRGSVPNEERVIPLPANQGNAANEHFPNPTFRDQSTQSDSAYRMPDSNTAPRPDTSKPPSFAAVEGIFKSIFSLYNELSDDEDDVTSSGLPKTDRVCNESSGLEETVSTAPPPPPPPPSSPPPPPPPPSSPPPPPPPNREVPADDDFDGEDSDRSEDNVLISNKYDNVQNQVEIVALQRGDEWIPIGTGNTLLHRDKYKTVNWTSYTTATRTLLVALFSRRTLATRSLTGKKSPAFQDKPAKSCLDPKKISDLIYEVTGRFKVKDNVIRGLITTKCADECKMLKARIKRKQQKRNKDSCKD